MSLEVAIVLGFDWVKLERESSNALIFTSVFHEEIEKI